MNSKSFLIETRNTEFKEFDPEKKYKELTDNRNGMNEDLKVMKDVKNGVAEYFEGKCFDGVSELIHSVEENKNIKIKEYVGKNKQNYNRISEIQTKC